MPILLAIDNDAASRRSLLAAVPDDWTVLQAATGVEALDLVPQWGLQFSVVLVDPQLPDLDGVLVCAQLRILLPSVFVKRKVDHQIGELLTSTSFCRAVRSANC
jgi:CheY-like chemotaxis protein